jgi:hypothetical protein
MLGTIKPFIKSFIVLFVGFFSIVLSVYWINVDPELATNLWMALFCLLLGGLHTFIAIEMIDDKDFFLVVLSTLVALFQMSVYWDIIINIINLK